MIACTSPAGTCSVTPLRIGLSATVAWRLEMSSILVANVLPRGAVGEEVAAHIVHRVLADAFKHALVVERLLPVLDGGFLEVDLLLLARLDRPRFAQSAALAGEREPVGDDCLLLAIGVEQELAAPRRLAREDGVRGRAVAPRDRLIECI